jgi:hypothetical protein
MQEDVTIAGQNRNACTDDSKKKELRCAKMPHLAIPDDVRKAARQGLKLLRDGYSGGTPTGWARAAQLEAGGHISMQDAMTMRAWFARHYYTSRPNYVEWLRSTTSRRQKKRDWHGAVAWLIWGGDPAYEWILSKDVQKAIVVWGKGRGKKLVLFVPPKPLPGRARNGGPG